MERQPIHNIESENIVLSAILGNASVLGDIREFLLREPFYDDTNKKIFDAILKLDEKGQPTDMVSVIERFTGTEDFDKVQERIIEDIIPLHSDDYRYYAKHLKDMEMKRALWELSKRMQLKAADPTEDVADVIGDGMVALDAILQYAPTDGIRKFSDVLAELQKVVNNNTSGISEPGYPTGYNILDKTGGLHPADLVVIAAESSQGKTALAMNILLGAAKRGTPSAVYSMEMTSTQMAARFVAMEAGLQNSDILYKPQSRDDLLKFDGAVGRLEFLPIYFDDRSTSNIDTIIASVRRLVKRYGIKIAVVDYIQMLTLTSARRNQTDEQILGSIARRLKNLAKELEICIVAISQLNRDYANPVPSMNRLRASGQIGEAADVVMLLYRPEAVSNGRDNKYPAPDQNVNPAGTAKVNIGKGRNTGLAECFLRFVSASLRFEEFGAEHVPMLDAKEIKKDNDSPF